MRDIKTYAALFVLATCLSAGAEGAQEIEATFGDWSKVCATADTTESNRASDSNTKVCQIVQTASEDDSGNRLLQTTIGYIASSEKPILTLTAPLGIYLPRGIIISVDDTPITATVQRCDGNGCMAFIAMENTLIESMRKHDKGSVLIATTPQNNVKLPLSLKGFSDAFASLEAKPAQSQEETP